MKNVGIFYAHLEYIMAIWCILWSFGNFVIFGRYIFHHFGILCQEKSGNPGQMLQLLFERFFARTPSCQTGSGLNVLSQLFLGISLRN
jgi:hypothetical protein